MKEWYHSFEFGQSSIKWGGISCLSKIKNENRTPQALNDLGEFDNTTGLVYLAPLTFIFSV